MDLDRFFQGSSAIAICIQLYRYLSLAAWRDLPRERGNDAPSTSLDPLYIQDPRPFVLNDKIVRDG